MATPDLYQISQKTRRVERHWIAGKTKDLEVYRIPIGSLYFNIENGRYADRMLRLRNDNKGVKIDPRAEKWKLEIEKMLAGEHKDTAYDRDGFIRLMEDIDAREQIRPGVVLADGGVIDGNRRLGALRRLSQDSKNPSKYAWFDGVILPDNTTDEDRWRIEAGLQLSTNERADYSPINELLKIRSGLQIYKEKVDSGEYPSQKPAALVAKAIFGRTVAQIEEMAGRLDLIDEYLEFVERPGDYDRIGEVSERFLEARRVIAAAENHQRDPKFVGKLKAILFYLICTGEMDNWDIRLMLNAQGGDPTKRGKKPKANLRALQEFMDEFPEPRAIQKQLTTGSKPSVPPAEPPPEKSKEPGGGKSSGKRTGKPKKADKVGPPPDLDEKKIEAGKERFLRTIKAADDSKSLRNIAEGARADVQVLVEGLTDAKRLAGLEPDDRTAISESVGSMTSSLKACDKALKKK